METLAGLARLSPAFWIFGLTLVVVPGLGAPFSAPKALLLEVAAGAFALWAIVRPSRKVPRALASFVFAWMGAAALSTLFSADGRLPALLLVAGTGASLLGLASVGWDGEAAEIGIALGGGALASVVLLQWMGWDPFRLAGLMPAIPGSRMRLYGTLGNPDFAAGLLGATFCITAGRLWARVEKPGHRLGWAVVGLLQGVALAVIGSFATLLALGAALGILALARLRRFLRWGIPAGLICALGLGWGASGRNASHALAGRLYLWEVAAPHWAESPWVGLGPGSVWVHWPAWEADFRARHPDADPSFAGLQDHAHDDYLEALLDTGLLGALAFIGMIACALGLGVRAGKRDPRALAATCAIASLAARALVDFPFHRPAELGLFALLVAQVVSFPSPVVQSRSPACPEDVFAPPSCSPSPPPSC